MSSLLLADPATIQTTDPRFQALFQLAHEGVEEAASDLWHEYGVYWFRPASDEAGTVDVSIKPARPGVIHAPSRILPSRHFYGTVRHSTRPMHASTREARQ